jgi:hemoglobin-like flavoprotein
MGSGLVTEAKVAPASAAQPEENKQVVAKSSQKPFISRQLSFFSRYIGMSTATSDEMSEARQFICHESWKLVGNTLHRYSDGQTLRGIELFCKMFMSNLSTNDLSEDGAVVNGFRPRKGSHNYNSASMLRRIVKYMLSIRHESRNAKQNLRALGRTHARIKIERPQFELFTISFIETLVLFPGVTITGEVIDAWASLMKFAIDQMCFDKIVFRDHCTLNDPEDMQKNISPFDLDNSSHTYSASCTLNSSMFSASSELFQKMNHDDVGPLDYSVEGNLSDGPCIVNFD